MTLPDETVRPLRRLLHKYDLLLALSRGEPGRTEERRDAMRAIAHRFPAALREWEQIAPEELGRRHRIVAEQVAAGERREAALALDAASEGWLHDGLDLHDCLRAVLRLRGYLIRQAGGRLPRGGATSPAALPPGPIAAHLAACQELVRGCEVPWLTVTPELLGAIAEPAAGRLTALAYQAVAARHGTSTTTIKIAIFGLDRPGGRPAEVSLAGAPPASASDENLGGPG